MQGSDVTDRLVRAEPPWHLNSGPLADGQRAYGSAGRGRTYRGRQGFMALMVEVGTTVVGRDL